MVWILWGTPVGGQLIESVHLIHKCLSATALFMWIVMIMAKEASQERARKASDGMQK